MALLRNFGNIIRRSNAFRNAMNLSARKNCGYAVDGQEGCSLPKSRGLVLGIYSDENDKADPGELTSNAKSFDNCSGEGKITEALKTIGKMPKRGECLMFYNVTAGYPTVAVCGLGDKCLGYNAAEQIDEGKEAIRIAAATGCRALQDMEINQIFVESFGNSECAAEGAFMSTYRYQDYKTVKNRVHEPILELYAGQESDCDYDGWLLGTQKAKAQNFARELMETPANKMSPTRFARNVVLGLCDSGISIEIKVRDWIESHGLSSFLAISDGSVEPPIFMELTYNGSTSDDPPVVMIGQGMTYNCGGICLKKLDELAHMRGEMLGAACAISACRAIASMRIPVNIRVLVPLCEHMIGASSVKCGDIITSLKGHSVEIECTDHAGVLVLNDTLTMAQKYSPKMIIDIGTLSCDIDEALGEVCAGVYTNDEELWNRIKFAGVHTGDRVWRLPLWNYFETQLRRSPRATLQNVGVGRGGGSCKAAAFLNQFVPEVPWLHIDAHGIMTTNGKDIPYLCKGMAGRPTRTLIEFIAHLTCLEGEKVKICD